jgi:transposase
MLYKIDRSEILYNCEGGGESSYHQQILLKILIYAYLNILFSSCKIEKPAKCALYLDEWTKFIGP